ncbi:type I-F CRISPR-associated helicase Cas3 [Endozoicomonas sp. G2_1]|nr:type I-F CRISPR-associated helicase Cas3f [Endozoicomonas sp. G2_1]MBO9489124.1 type I-F CRISPR-associated helicase Cas3 [Endozoicomonas sp. G2_1]
MMVTFVSQCEKNALKKTRRVLDAFANRIGDNTWQTLITEDGLQTVKKMLRQTATKSTAVSCHWIRSRSRSQFLWVVGNKRKFNNEGVVPVNSTRGNLLNADIESDWHYLPLIKALSALAALFHDWGKASELFQEKLSPKSKNKYKGDPIRHEWISCLLLHALVQLHQKENDPPCDNAWLSALAQGEINEKHLQTALSKTNRPEAINPFNNLPPIAQFIAWLTVSHHRLPLDVKGEYQTRNLLTDENNQDYSHQVALTKLLTLVSCEWGYKNNYDPQEYQARIKACFNFPKGLLSESSEWLKQIKKWANRLLACQQNANASLTDGSFRLVLHHARLCLMLADHNYSSKEADKFWRSNTKLFANTDRNTGEFKQKLDEHLVGVAKQAIKNAHLLPAFETEPPSCDDNQALRKPSPKAFRWQDKAVDKILQWRKIQSIKSEKQGFFAVNMASTGTGKTFANAKVMRALSPNTKSLRYILALGLRTLTLQTGDEYRERVGLDDSELAVLIGAKSVLALHNQAKVDQGELDKNSYESYGAESQAELLKEAIDYDCLIPEQTLTTILTGQRERKFLYAPVLVCTIDHIISATETKRGGRYILPSLRLMSSDLVIDEIDDFTGDDLIAIGRLIHLAGMLGRKVMISSATIPPSLAEGYFKAYRDGWLVYCKSKQYSVNIGCAWIDEFNTDVASVNNETLEQVIPSYRSHHQSFIAKRMAKLQKAVIKRKADIIPCQHIIDHFNGLEKHEQRQSEIRDSKQQMYFTQIAQAAFAKHQAHHTLITCDNQTQLAVSFGVIRTANISPCVNLTKFLLDLDCPADTEIRVMAYHSQQVLLLRHAQEQHLDAVLKRKEAASQVPQAFNNPVIRQHLEAISRQRSTNYECAIKNVLFILVATPVEEVGRDHDFDWAIVEPSSFRSIIQLAGRVRRHRDTPVTEPNVGLLQYNWKGIKYADKEDQQVFNYPGYEQGKYQLSSHKLNDLLNLDEISYRLDASQRIQKPESLQLHRNGNIFSNLAELEHGVTSDLLTKYKKTDSPESGLYAEVGPYTLQGYLREPWYLTALSQRYRPFRKNKAHQQQCQVFLLWNDQHQSYQFCEQDEQGYGIERELTLGIKRTVLSAKAYQRLWLVRDYDQLIEKQVEKAYEQADHLDAFSAPASKRKITWRFGELSFPFQEQTKYEYNDQLGLVKVEK